MRNFIYCTLMIILMYQPVWGQTIEGVIKDSSSNVPLPYSTIVLKRLTDTSKIYRSQSADDLGKFRFDSIGTGQYLVQVSYSGYKRKEILILLNDQHQNFDVAVILLQRSRETLSEVIVKAKKRLYSFGPGKIIYEVENDTRLLGKDGLEVLRLAPLISVGGTDNIQLKGKSNFIFHLNGKRFPALSANPSEFLRTLNYSQITKIEIITNPSAKYSAEGTNGIINIITKEMAFKNLTVINLGYDTYNTFNSMLSFYGRKGKLGYNFSIGKTYWKNGTSTYKLSQQIKNNVSIIKGETIPQRNIFNSFGSLIYEVNKRNKVDLDFRVSDGSGNIRRSFFASNRDINTKNRLLDLSYSISSDWEHKFDSLSSLVISYKTENANNKNEVWSDVAAPVFNKGISSENTIQADFQDPHLQFGAAAILRNHNSQTAIPDMAEDNNYTIHQNVFAAYVSYYHTVFRNYQVEAGIRGEYTGYQGIKQLTAPADSLFLKQKYSQLFPSLNINRYFDKSAINISFGYSRRIQRPQLYYLNPFINAANPYSPVMGNLLLNYELANNFDLGISKTGKNNEFHMLNVSYQVSSNSIADFLFPIGDSIIASISVNFKQQHLIGLSHYSSFSLPKRMRIILSNNFYRTVYPAAIPIGTDSAKFEVSNNGFYGTCQLTLSGVLFKKLNWEILSIYTLPEIYLQGKSSSFFYQNLTFNSSFLKNKLRAYISLRQPFFKKFNYRTIYSDKNFTQTTENLSPQRRLWVGITYSFGKNSNAKAAVRKKIENKDKKSKNLMEDIK